MLESITWVDEVIALPEMKSDADYQKLVEKVSPQIVAVTQGDPVIDKKKAHVKRIGARIVEIKKIKTPSTSKIIQKFGDA